MIPKPQVLVDKKMHEKHRDTFFTSLALSKEPFFKMLGWNASNLLLATMDFVGKERFNAVFGITKNTYLKTKTWKKQSLSYGVIYICSTATGISHPARSERHFDLHRSPVPLARYQVTSHALAFFSSFSLDFLSANSRFIRSRTSSPRSL